MTNMEELLAGLSNAHGISGYEGSIREILEEELSPYMDEARSMSFNLSSLFRLSQRVKQKILLSAGS